MNKFLLLLIFSLPLHCDIQGQASNQFTDIQSTISRQQVQIPESILIKNANYLDLNSGTYKTASIKIENGLISEIDEDQRIDQANTFDAKGKYILPGLVDAHIHLFQSGGIYTRPDALDLTMYLSYDEERQWLKANAGDLLQRYLKAGITTVIDIGGPMYNFKIRDEFQNKPDYPNLFLTGPLVSSYQPEAFKVDDPPIIKVHNEAEARAVVQQQIPYNPDFIKIWGIPLPTLKSDELYNIMLAAIEESKKNNLRVAIHATDLNTAKLAVKAGADILVHSVRNPIDQEFIQMVKSSNVVYIPTLVVTRNYRRTFAQDFIPTSEDFNISNPTVLGQIFDSEHLTEVPNFDIAKAAYPKALEMLGKNDSIAAENIRQLHKAEVVIATGTDAGNVGTLHGSSYFDEVEAMRKSGLSNLDIIRASTINGAKVLAKEETIGSIEVGKLADLVFYSENPLSDLDHLKRPTHVMKAGKLHKSSEILPDTPESLAQKQLNAYNSGNIDAFLEPYADDVEIYDFPSELTSKGKENIRSGYAAMFKNNPNLHCELINRVVEGNTVIDHESITGIKGMEVLKAVAIYKIENHKISKVYFIME